MNKLTAKSGCAKAEINNGGIQFGNITVAPSRKIFGQVK